MDLNKIMDELSKEVGPVSNQTSDWFKIKEGRNRVRILSELCPVQSHFKYGTCTGDGCTFENENGEHTRPTVKFLTWLWSYDDNELKLGNLSFKVASALQSLQNDPDYSFSEVPMPYDITITAVNAGTKEVEYSVTPARSNSEVPPEAFKKLEKKSKVSDIRDSMKNKKLKELGIEDKAVPVSTNTVPYPNEIDPSKIPF